MPQSPACPKCHSLYTYIDGLLIICSQCAHEWTHKEEHNAERDELELVKDAYGVILNDNDTITVIKDLKIKGSSQIVKIGTKVRNIRLLPGEDHNIDCKIEGIGAMKLKSEFVKKI